MANILKKKLNLKKKMSSRKNETGAKSGNSIENDSKHNYRLLLFVLCKWMNIKPIYSMEEDNF